MLKITVYFVTFTFVVFFHTLAFSASLPKSTVEMLKKLSLDSGMLADVHRELQVPSQWIEQAKKEGHLRVLTSPGGAAVNSLPFRERYPFINVEFSSGNVQDRSVKTLIAYKAGRVIGDVIESVGDVYFEFKKAGALEDLRDIPAMAHILDAAKDPEGLWVAYGMGIYCMAYNTKLARKTDLPRKWEDLLNNPAWRKGNLALANRPGNWAISLWKAKGEEWTKRFLERLFAEVEPQRRKEGLNALVPLVAAGEFHAVIPASHGNTYRTVLDGGPVGFNCPEPVPATVSELVIIKGSPHTYAAKLYLNWVLSKEGQLARAANYSSAPVHKDLQLKQFLPFGEEFLEKKRGFADMNDEYRFMPELMAFWNRLWLRGGSAK